MKKSEIKDGMTVYVLDRSCYNPNDEKELFVECKVSEENGKLIVRAVGEYEFEYKRLNFDANFMRDVDDFIFETKEQAIAQYEKEFQEWKLELESKTKQQMVNEFLLDWIGEYPQHIRRIETMKNKIEKEFGLRPE